MIVTVSRAYGAAALAVSRAVAEPSRLPARRRATARRRAAWLGTSADVVETVSERPRGFGERVLDQLGGGVPEAAQPPASEPISAPKRDARSKPPCARRRRPATPSSSAGWRARCWAAATTCVRVFVNAPLAWRVAHVAESLGVDEAAARAEVARIDEARRTYAREGYRVIVGRSAQLRPGARHVAVRRRGQRGRSSSRRCAQPAGELRPNRASPTAARPSSARSASRTSACCGAGCSSRTSGRGRSSRRSGTTSRRSRRTKPSAR